MHSAPKVEEWFKTWRKPVRSWLINRCGVYSHEGDDLVQEVFCRIMRYQSAEMVENPQGYIFRVAQNVAHEWRQRSRIRRPHSLEWLDELLADEGYQPESIEADESQQRYVMALLNTLKPRQRQILLFHVDGLTYKQIALRLGVTYRIVLRDLTTAYAKLRSEIKQESAL